MPKPAAHSPLSRVSPLHAFTVDLEDYFHVSAFEECVSRDDWDRFPRRVVRNTEKLLDILAENRVKATFFVLGWIAERFPQLVREISHAGHEVGSHGCWHRLVYSQTPAGFRADVRRSIEILEDILGLPVTAYRAPSFSVTAESQWATEILVEEGILVDSSVMPVHHDLYGMPGARTGLHRLETAAGALWEFPPSVDRFLGLPLPVGGGGYFRLYPYWFTQWRLRRLEARGEALMFYIHPWEIDPDQPRLRASLKSRFRHYQNLRSTARKLDRLLKTFRFGPICDVLAGRAVRRAFHAHDALCLNP
jgi:polysaccharide deacetylase family protein (PEP-CTERM system associated)